MDPLYLSRLCLAVRNRTVQTDLSDCHAVHRRLLLAFPNLGGMHDAREHFGVLYRIESGAHDVDILLQSTEQPDWGRLPEGYLREPVTSVKRIDPLYAAIVAGQDLVFRLRANPTRRIAERLYDHPTPRMVERNAIQGERWRGKRVDVRGEEDQMRWLQRKGEGAGFALLGVRLHRDVADVRTETGATVHGSVSGMRKGAGRMTFGSVTFEGRVRVTDAERFRGALVGGIGSGKAYGFGLLSIAPGGLNGAGGGAASM